MEASARIQPRLAAADLLTLAACAACLLAFLGARDVEGVRERRLAGSAADIDSRGDWMLPRLLGLPRFLKPPLPDWAAAAGLKLLGRTELALRLPFALAGLGMLLAAYLLARDLAGPAAARLTAVILATTPYFAAECRSASADILLAFFVSAAMLAFHHWQKEGRPWSPSWWALYVCLALGCLSKGPVALALVGLPIAFELGLRRDGRWRLLWALRPWWGLAVNLALVLPWVIWTAAAVDGAIEGWLADLRRSVSGEQAETIGHLGPLLHWPRLTFPWSVLGLAALLLPLWRKRMPEWTSLRPIYLWLAVDFVFLSAWSRHPIHYLLPLAAPAAVLEGALCARLLAAFTSNAAARWPAWGTRALALTFAGWAAAAGVLLYRVAGWSVLGASLLALVLAVPAGLAFIRARSPRRVFLLLAASGFACSILAASAIRPAQSRKKSHAAFSQGIARVVPPGRQVHFIAMREAAPFYAAREFRRVELQDGPEATECALLADGPGFLVLSRDTYLRLSVSPLLRLELLLEDPGDDESDECFYLVRFSSGGAGGPSFKAAAAD